MNKSEPSAGNITPAADPPIGGSPRHQLQIRTRELAALAGRLPHEITQADYEQAKREVTGESNLDRQNAFLYADT